MRLCLVEDIAVAGLEPLTLTRPVFDLLLGGDYARVTRSREASGSVPVRGAEGAVIRPHLAAVRRQRDPHTAVNDRDWLARGPGHRRQRPLGSPGRFQAPRSAGSWLGLCDGQPACALVGPDEAVGLEPDGVDRWFEDSRRRGSEGRRSAASGSPAPGISSPATPSTWSATSRPRQSRAEQPPSRDGRPGRAGRPAVHPRVGADRSLHRLRHDQRADHDRRRASGCNRSPGSKGRARSAATPSSSAPICGAA